MVEHRFQNRLVCHQCGETRPIPTPVPAAGSRASWPPSARRRAHREEVAARFPRRQGHRAVLGPVPFRPRAQGDIAQISEGDTDIIIGTQNVAKGHNFPRLTLVGVVDADLACRGRSARGGAQLSADAPGAGRAGRQSGAAPGVALLQTHQPDHAVIRAILSGQDETFWDAEARAVRRRACPPFGRLAGIILSHAGPGHGSDFARHLAGLATPLAEVGAELWGPRLRPSRGCGTPPHAHADPRAASAPLQAAIADCWRGSSCPRTCACPWTSTRKAFCDHFFSTMQRPPSDLNRLQNRVASSRDE